jgi:hypothetical protein
MPSHDPTGQVPPLIDDKTSEDPTIEAPSWLLAGSSAPTACDTLPGNAFNMLEASPPAMAPGHESHTPRIETQLPSPTKNVRRNRKVYAHFSNTKQLALRRNAVLLWLRDMDVTIESAQGEGLISDLSMNPEVRNKIKSHLVDLSRNLRRRTSMTQFTDLSTIKPSKLGTPAWLDCWVPLLQLSLIGLVG